MESSFSLQSNDHRPSKRPLSIDQSSNMAPRLGGIKQISYSSLNPDVISFVLVPKASEGATFEFWFIENGQFGEDGRTGWFSCSSISVYKII